MFTAYSILMVCALLCLIFAAISRPKEGFMQIGWLGMFFWALATLLGKGI